MDDIFEKADEVNNLICLKAKTTQIYYGERKEQQTIVLAHWSGKKGIRKIDVVDVYRKPTISEKMMPSDSYQDFKHKVAAYHSMKLIREKMKPNVESVYNFIQKWLGYLNQFIGTTK